MSDFSPDIILDINGDPVGRFRRNQDPTEVTRLHPVPKLNAWNEPIMDGDTPAVQMLPLDDPRAVAQLESEGLRVADDGITLVAIEGHKLTDPSA